MGYIYQPKLKSGGRCKIWWMKYYVDGRPVRESTETSEHEEARRLLRLREGDVAKGKPLPVRANKITFEKLAEDFLVDYQVNGRKSAKRAKLSVEALKLSFAGKRALGIKTPDIRTHIALRQGQGCANGTINRELAALKRMFNLALQAETLPHTPYVPMFQERNVRTGFFSEADYLALREALPSVLRPPCDFAYQYGWRRGEILGLTWERVDLQAGTIRLEPGTTKNDAGRTISLTPEILATLRRLRAETVALEQRTGRAVPWVFTRRGRRMGSFARVWETACTRAQLPGRLFHDFRRTAGRNMLRQGIPETTIMQIMGHKTPSKFRRYCIVSQQDLDEAAKKMAVGTFEPFSGHVEPSIPEAIRDLPPA